MILPSRMPWKSFQGECLTSGSTSILPPRWGTTNWLLFFVEYGNRGTAPMEAPMLVVTALQIDQPGALMTLDPTFA